MRKTCLMKQRKKLQQFKEEFMSKFGNVTRHVNPYAHAFQLFHEMKEGVIAEKIHEAAESMCSSIGDKNLSTDQNR